MFKLLVRNVARVIAFLVVCCVLIFIVRRQFEFEIARITQRRFEATESIERVYAYFDQHGEWPTKSDLEKSGHSWLPPKWHYDKHEGGWGAVIMTHDSFHTLLSYQFEPPEHGKIHTMWTLSIEGDKRKVPAEIEYSLKTKP